MWVQLQRVLFTHLEWEVSDRGRWYQEKTSNNLTKELSSRRVIWEAWTHSKYNSRYLPEIFCHPLPFIDTDHYSSIINGY